MKKLTAIVLTLLLCVGLLAGCGITVVQYTGEGAVSPAPEEETPSGEPVEVPEGELALGFNMVANLAFGHSGSANATAEADGLAQANVDIYAVTINSEGVIVDCKIDAIQCKVKFDAAGQLVTPVGTEFLSKMELKDDYAMRGASGIKAEWFEQVEALEEYCIGKTPEEVANIALDDAGKATDADLIAGITMPLGDFIAGVVGACENARVSGAKEGDTLYMHSVSAMSDSSKSASDEGDGLAQCDTTAGAYTIAADGTITDIELDCVQTKININTAGEITNDQEATAVTTKTDLEYDYDMLKASPIGKEWFEQTNFFEDYCKGKTVDAVAATEVNPDNGHVAESEVDLVAGCTMNINDFVTVLTKSTGAAAEPLVVPEGELALGFNMVANLAFGHSGSANATAEADGLAQANVDIYAVTINSEGVIVDCKIDAIQCKVKFDAAGQLVTPVGTEFLSKMELKDDYAMRGASGIKAEWFEQVEALEEYCIGKTPEEVANIALDDAGKATDADLIAGITMPLGDFIAGVVGACENARVSGAKEGDTLYMHSVSAMSDSSKSASDEGDGLAQCDTTAGAYTIAADGTITDIELDCVQTKININTAGEITNDQEATAVTTKTDLEYDYDMLKASPIGKEWFEQTNFFEDYCKGKTVDAVAATEVNPDNGHVAESEVDLVAGCTMNINDFVVVLTKSK